MQEHEASHQKRASSLSSLSKVLRYMRDGWPNQIPSDLERKPFLQQQISIESDRLLWGIRVIVPSTLQQQVLNEGHPGIQRMEAVARSYMWWNGLDQEIEKQAKSCKPCQEHTTSCTIAHMAMAYHSNETYSRSHRFRWTIPKKFIIVDAHSKWPEVIIMSSTTSEKTILKLSPRSLQDMVFLNR